MGTVLKSVRVNNQACWHFFLLNIYNHFITASRASRQVTVLPHFGTELWQILSTISFKKRETEVYLCFRTSGVHGVVVVHAAGFGERGEQTANRV